MGIDYLGLYLGNHYKAAAESDCADPQKDKPQRKREPEFRQARYCQKKECPRRRFLCRSEIIQTFLFKFRLLRSSIIQSLAIKVVNFVRLRFNGLAHLSQS